MQNEVEGATRCDCEASAVVLSACSRLRSRRTEKVSTVCAQIVCTFKAKAPSSGFRNPIATQTYQHLKTNARVIMLTTQVGCCATLSKLTRSEHRLLWLLATTSQAKRVKDLLRSGLFLRGSSRAISMQVRITVTCAHMCDTCMYSLRNGNSN